MKKLVKVVGGLIILWFVLGRVVLALEGVGALMDRLSAGGTIEVVGRTAPWAEVVVVNASLNDEVVVLAEVEAAGEFSFEFEVSGADLSNLQIWARDLVGTTSRVGLSDGLGSEILLPPTIVNDTGDISTTAVALMGYTYPGSEVTVAIENDKGYEESVVVTADAGGKWQYKRDELPLGVYTGTGIARVESLTSKLSQEIYFEILAFEVPVVVIELVETIGRIFEVIIPEGILESIAEIREFLAREPEIVARVLAPVAAVPVVGFWLKDLVAVLLKALYGVLHLLGWREKRRKWGVVFDSVTKQPLSRAIVRIYSVVDKSLLETDVTGNNGLFSFLPKAGAYIIGSARGGYRFPSILVKGSGRDGEYEHLYHGERFEVGEGEELKISVPMDKVDAVVGGWFYVRRYLGWVWKWLGLGLLVFGLGVAVRALLLGVSLLNVGVVGFYLVLLVGKAGGSWSRRRGWGLVRDSKTGKVVEGVVISLYEIEFKRLVARRVSDEKGRFQLVVPPGRYKIDVVSSVGYKLDVERGKGYGGEVIEVGGTKPKALAVQVWVRK